jgi:hypothetical protein
LCAFDIIAFTSSDVIHTNQLRMVRIGSFQGWILKLQHEQELRWQKFLVREQEMLSHVQSIPYISSSASCDIRKKWQRPLKQRGWVAQQGKHCMGKRCFLFCLVTHIVSGHVSSLFIFHTSAFIDTVCMVERMLV